MIRNNRLDGITIYPLDISLEPDFDKNDKIVLGCLCILSARQGDSKIVDLTPSELAPKLSQDPNSPVTDEIVRSIFDRLEGGDYLLIESIKYSESMKPIYEITLLPKAEVIRETLKEYDSYTGMI